LARAFHGEVPRFVKEISLWPAVEQQSPRGCEFAGVRRRRAGLIHVAPVLLQGPYFDLGTPATESAASGRFICHWQRFRMKRQSQVPPANQSYLRIDPLDIHDPRITTADENG
jgi:hypothetical protein